MARNFNDKTFTKILRGYSPDEVKEYIAYIDGEYRKLERISTDNVRKLALALRKLDEMNNYAESLEKQIEEQSAQLEDDNGKAEINYEELARLKAEIEAKAKQDAEAMLADAREKSGDIIAEAQAKGEQIVTEAEELARSVRDKILIEAATKAEMIIKEAQTRTEESRKSAETMGAAALKMYSEVLSFRDTLFEAYNTHIESIEEIIETADELFGDEEEENNSAPEPAEENEPVVEEVIDTEDDEELLGAVDISEYGDMLDSLEEEADELDLDMSDFRDIIDDIPMSEAAAALEDEFVVVSDEPEEKYAVIDEPAVESIDEPADEYDFSPEDTAEYAPEVAGEYVSEESDGDEWISAEEWDAENSGEYTEDLDDIEGKYTVAPIDEDEPVEYTADVQENDTYESYGETAAEEDEIDPIELEAQKYSDVYVDDFDDDDEDFYSEQPTEDEELYPDFENATYAPSPEYSWGDDMYAEPTDEDEYVEEYAGEYGDEYGEDFDDDVTFMEELPAAPVYDEEDELDRLKQFFSADFDESAAKRRDYDTTSNSTTSIALSLNDFFEDGADLSEDYGYGTDDDMESLFEKKDMSITDEFDIVFGKMDSAKSVDEIRRQPIIAPEEPKKHKKHKKF